MMRPVLLALGGCCLLLAVVFRSGLRRQILRGLTVAFVVLVAFDIITVARSYYVSQSSGLFSDGTGIGLLQEHVGDPGTWRIECLRFGAEDVKALPPNAQQLYGLQCSHGRSTIVPASYGDLYDVSSESAPRLPRFRADTPLSPLELLVADFANVRYMVTSRTNNPYVTPPFFRALVAAGGDRVPIGIVGPSGDGRLGMEQGAGEILSFQLETPALSSLEFAVGFGSDAKRPGDSVYFWLTWESELSRASFVRGFDLYQDGQKWHESGLNLSGVGGGLTTVRMGLGTSRGVDRSKIAGAWSGFDMVEGHYDFRRIQSGYEIYPDDGADYLSLLVESTAREVPLNIKLDKGLGKMRWVAFPSHLSARRIEVDARGSSEGAITVQSDSLFVLRDAKAVYLGTSYPELQLVWDRDMHIYENFAAIPRFLCIDWEGLKTHVVDGKEVVRIGHVGGVGDIVCGDCTTECYDPERVVLKTESAVDCCLLVLDSYFPGWRAEVDGSDVEILRTDIGMRAINLGAGQHHVVLTYRPLSLMIGILLTSIGGILSCVYAWYRPQP